MKKNNKNTEEKEMIFKYTAKKDDFLGIALAFGFLGLIEGGLIGLLVGLLVPGGWWKPLIFGLLALLYGAVFAFLFGPLTGKHSLTQQKLNLRFGYAFSAVINRENISTATPAQEKVEMPLPFRAEIKAGAVRAAFSPAGQIWLQLRVPQKVRLTFKKIEVSQILINVDKQTEFLAALGLEQTAKPAQVEKETGEIEKTEKTERAVAQERQDAKPPEIVFRSPGRPLTSDESTIRTEGLIRRYPDGFVAVNNLELNIASGEIYGFLGSNGAGKTTTIKMLVGLLQPTAGQAFIDGYNIWTAPEKAKNRLGYVADRAILYDRLTGLEFLNFLAQMRELPLAESRQRIAELLDMLELGEQTNRPCGAYSFGMKRKLSLAGALLHQPSVLILDEPLNGLDPRSARRLKDLFAELAAAGTTILLSTHDLAAAETVCHRVGILHRGTLLAEGSAAELRSMAEATDLEAVFLNLTAA